MPIVQTKMMNVMLVNSVAAITNGQLTTNFVLDFENDYFPADSEYKLRITLPDKLTSKQIKFVGGNAMENITFINQNNFIESKINSFSTNMNFSLQNIDM